MRNSRPEELEETYSVMPDLVKRPQLILLRIENVSGFNFIKDGKKYNEFYNL